MPALETAGFLPETVDVVAMSHLHFDHAGGLLRADGERAFPHATIVAQRAEWEVALGDNPRLVASYVQPELRLVETGASRAGPTASSEILPGRVGRSRPAATRPATRRSSCAGPATARGRWRSSATCFMRPWAANPRWVTAFDDFPLDSVVRKAELFAPGRRRGLDRSSCRTRREHPVGRLVRDRDRFRYEPI